MFRNIYYKILVWASYQIGDIVCHWDYEWCGNLYQKCMLFSYDCDEKIGFQFWQVLPLNKETNL